MQIGCMTAQTVNQSLGMPSFILGEQSPGCPSNNLPLPPPPLMLNTSPLWKLQRSWSGFVACSWNFKKESQDQQLCISIIVPLTSSLGTLSTMLQPSISMFSTITLGNVLLMAQLSSDLSGQMTWC